MINQVKKYFSTVSKVCVLEHITFESKTEYNYVELSIKKGNLTIHRQETFLNLTSFKKLNSKKLPVILNVNGVNILTKVNPTNMDTFENDNFIFSAYTMEANTYYSIVRKSAIADSIDYLNKNNYLLVDICVGAFNIVRYKELIHLNNQPSLPHVFETVNNQINYSFEREDSFLYQKVKVGEQEVPTNLISPLVTGLDYLLNGQHKKDKLEFLANREESVYAKLLPVISLYFIGILFVALVGNYFYQSHLSKKYQDSELEATFLEERRMQLQTLQQDIQEKRRIFNQSGLATNHGYAEYSDVLASLMPKRLSLNSLSISPILKELKNDKKVELESDKIWLSGEVNELETLNEYLIKIEQHELFKKAKIVVFNKVKMHSEFELEIEI